MAEKKTGVDLTWATLRIIALRKATRETAANH